MKKTIVFLFLILPFASATASHISGGEMIYEYLGPGAAPNTKKYRITLKLFRDNKCFNCAEIPSFVRIGIFNNNNNLQIPMSPFDVYQSSEIHVPVTPPPNCMTNPPELNYAMGSFVFIIDLPDNANGYTAVYQTCCRVTPIENIATIPPPGQGEGSTYVCTIPGSNQLASGNNSSPQFRTQLGPVCYRTNFTFDFSAFDPDGDSLVYSFCNAFNRGASTNSAPVNPSTPPYQSVNYINGYSGTTPLGPGAVLNARTGIISGLAPQSPGRYVVCVCIDEYRNGVLIGRHRKDFILTVHDCAVATASLPASYTNCDGFTLTFTNIASPDNIDSYYWEFGDGNTSTLPVPTHTYAAAGDYTLKLVVNRGSPCADSSTSVVKVYPGFRPDFTFAGQCKNTAIQFSDITTADYGIINFWKWNFGNPSSPANSSALQNPTHIYSTPGLFDVSFIVMSTKGCIDTILKTIEILDKPPLTVTGDTLICFIDTLQLQAIGTGTFNWSPNYNINNTSSATPLVSPDVPTTYYVTITDPFGCKGSDSIKVDVKLFVTLAAGNDTLICKSDQVVLQLHSDALHYQWTETPSGSTLNNPTLKSPIATPLKSTTYHVVGNIGKCIAEDEITVTPVPYPGADAGSDQHICFGNDGQLNASGGSIYSWTPEAFLTAANIHNPVVVNPTANIRYIVTVRDVLGCPKPVKDTVMIFVDKIVADAGPADTSVVIGQPLQLYASGSINYSWTPSTWLNNTLISNPVAFPQNDILYKVRVSNNTGCFDTDSIRVHVFKVLPDLFVPNAFTPNNDGINDIFKPIPIGMKSVDIFKIYNRWGQLLYSGTGNGTGWNGKYSGKAQEAATYIWYAEGTDYLNNKIKRRGSVILIR
ncbi:MAG: PKD domain-containing protein [Ferruginibacter sp.]